MVETGEKNNYTKNIAIEGILDIDFSLPQLRELIVA
ncbi:MAG: hypothetical protein ACD_38C00139G0012 [uncultured bacterium]|nr:MAG: hypothetical protein ACD_38C00139G0012 [uncultured bacterium]KKQ85327.1 MAG: hypothetical protein UT04_C0005G0020 [Candidatus Daviesbacteria bacterium GW2011_GWF2_38_7]